MERRPQIPPRPPLNPCQPAERNRGLGILKESTRNLIQACGGLESAAALTRVGKTELGNYQSPNHPARCIPVDVAADLMMATGSLQLLEDLAALVDCLVVPLDGDGKGFEHDMAQLAEHAAATFRDFALALEQGSLGEKERKRLDRDLARIVTTALEARRHLREGAAERP